MVHQSSLRHCVTVDLTKHVTSALPSTHLGAHNGCMEGVRPWQLRTHWLAGYGIPWTACRRLARSGDPVAKLLIDTSQAANVSALTEQIRARGAISSFANAGWVTADAQVVRTILRDNRFRTVKPRDRSRLRPIQWIIGKANPGILNPLEPPSMLFVDQPEHTRLRRLVMRGFTPRAIDGLRTKIQQVTDRELDALANEPEADLVAAYTARIPIAIIAAMLGIPDEDVRYLQQTSEPGTRLVSSAIPSWRDYLGAVCAQNELDAYLDKHIARLRHSGADNSVLAEVIHDDNLTHVEVKTAAMLLLGAGFLTTTHMLGNAIVTLLRHPNQLAALRENPDQWPQAIEELIRYAGPFLWTVRVASENTEIAGTAIRPGQPVYLLFCGANTDPEVFVHPNDFDITRSNAREHVAFGTGIHACLGATLARLELHIGLRSLFERFPHLALAGDPTWYDSIAVQGYQRLPVTLGSKDGIAA
jgi:cytochrome P450